MRKWLRKHEVYFRTIASFILSVSAIIISIFQYYNSESQKEIAALQKDIAVAQAMPQLDIKIHKKSTGYDEIYDTAYLMVTNNGGAVYEFYVQVATFLEISAYNNNTPIQEAIVQFPVAGYFRNNFSSSSTRGGLATLFEYNNSRFFFNLAKQIREKAQDMGLFMANSEEHIYLHIHYKDIIKREHEEYYFVPFIGGAKMLQDQEGKDIFLKWKEQRPREFTSLNAEELLKEISNKFQ